MYIAVYIEKLSSRVSLSPSPSQRGGERYADVLSQRLGLFVPVGGTTLGRYRVNVSRRVGHPFCVPDGSPYLRGRTGEKAFGALFYMHYIHCAVSCVVIPECTIIRKFSRELARKDVA